MKFPSIVISSILLTLTFTTATPTPTLVQRNANAVISAINTISNQTVALNNTVAQYPGGLLGTVTALDILTESLQLNFDIRSATRAATNSANFTDSESNDVATAFVNLVPNVKASLTTIDSKKLEFENGLLGLLSLTEVVKEQVQSLKQSSDALGSAITAKLTSTYAGLAPLIVAQVDDAFQQVIDDYSD